MGYSQLITPNPDIPCTPGWCLQYVRQTFGLAARYDTATQAWEASGSQHADRNFPAGCWIAVWFSLEAIPAGHVALMAPDGSVYSSSDNSSTPHHHPSLDDLINYYAYYHLPLTYLGWTEDVAGTPVITGGGTIQAESTTTIQEDDDLAYTEDDLNRIIVGAMDAWSMNVRRYAGNRNALDTFNQEQAEHKAIMDAVAAIPGQVLFENRVDGRNLIDWLKQVRADLANIKPGATVDIPQLAKALSEQLAAADVAALAAQLQITVKGQ